MIPSLILSVFLTKVQVKRFRRIATRYDKLDVIFLGFLLFAFVVDFLILR